ACRSLAARHARTVPLAQHGHAPRNPLRARGGTGIHRHRERIRRVCPGDRPHGSRAGEEQTRAHRGRPGHRIHVGLIMTNPANILSQVKVEISKIVIGNESLIENLLIALLSRGHVLLVGPPGMAKTTLVKSFSDSLHLPFNRIQVTPDLMPSDILGNEILQENKTTGQREQVFIKGPVFTNILLADEINRTPPKTQAALLQAMQEKTVTLFGRTEKLAEPFMV